MALPDRSLQLQPNSIIVRGPLFPEPIQVIVVVPMGDSIKLIGKGLTAGQVNELILAWTNLP